MALLRRNGLLTNLKILQKFTRSAVKITMGDPLDIATGIEKREMLAILAGNEDPWNHKPIKRGAGTRNHPTEIPSALEERIIGCHCTKEQPYLVYTTIYKGQPGRCECGYWFTLVHKAPI